MGCTSAKHVSTVPSDEEGGKGKTYHNGDVFGDEYKAKTVEEVKYMHCEEERVATRNQDNLEKSATSNRARSQKDGMGIGNSQRSKCVPSWQVGLFTRLRVSKNSFECWMRKLRRGATTVQRRRT
ncbi:uncharacterized protein C1orf21-like isoform X1 [Erpetoichthys calabaricus]|uniref:uncharacterized protein C1orf21-like isoform X1 n=1 Tax=Erpetoichthys calabaricus TaxID=27687 RepID=UPI0010A04B2A|nr:uncharacterized protein C1orf21-like isoform X1 [Erpetoichthys calabaricus]